MTCNDLGASARKSPLRAAHGLVETRTKPRASLGPSHLVRSQSGNSGTTTTLEPERRQLAPDVNT